MLTSEQEGLLAAAWKLVLTGVEQPRGQHTTCPPTHTITYATGRLKLQGVDGAGTGPPAANHSALPQQ